MKNLFFINESERERILGMHHDATRKQYLKESNEEELDEIDWGRVGTATAGGAATGAIAGGGIGAIPGAIIGAAGSILYQVFSGPGSKDAAGKIV
jgi:hypothetical protein